MQTGKKILHLQKISGIYGSETHLGMLLPGLVRRGFEIDFIPILSDGCWFEEYFNGLKSKGVNVKPLHIRNDVDLIFLMQLYKIIKKEKYAMVHTHLIHGDLFGTFSAHFAGVPIIVSSKHGCDLHYSPKLYRLHGVLSPWVKKVITISQSLQDYCNKKEGMPLDKMTTIYYGLDTDGLIKKAEQHPFDRATLGLGPEHFIITFVARFVPFKGHKFLLNAMPEIVEKYPNVRLLLMGEGPLRPEMERMAADLKLENHIMFLGFRNDVPGILRDCQLSVSPTTGEGFGLGIAEAMIQNVAVVATDSMAATEYIENERSGVLVPPSDPAALRDAIMNLMGNPELRSRLAEAGRKTILERFTVEAMVNNTARLYTELLKS
jgi:glycosyltransferase involved in cell wall biosynthesis